MGDLKNETSKMIKEKEIMEKAIGNIIVNFEGQTGLFIAAVTIKRVIAPGSFDASPEALFQKVVTDVLLEPHIEPPQQERGGVQ
jgi:hypothetical protein